MLFLFCQPGLNNRNTIDFFIKNLIIKIFHLKKKNYIELNNLSYNKANEFFIKKSNFKIKKIRIFINSIRFYSKLKKVNNNKSFTHIFLDGYTIFDLLFFSLFKFKLSTKLIIYLRIPYDQIFLTKYFFIYAIQKIKLNDNVIFLTDTDKLKKHFRFLFNISCNVLPIPGKTKHINRLKKIKINNLKILFPGKSRDEKGLQKVVDMFKKKYLNLNIILQFQKNDFITKKLESVPNIKLRPTSDNLSYHNYLKSINDSDLMILPYTHKTYKLRSSGIFIDGIRMNKILFVPEGTWMSDILKKFKLNDLVLREWEVSIMYKKIYKINSNFNDFSKNYKKLRNSIIKQNSESALNKKFLKLLKN